MGVVAGANIWFHNFCMGYSVFAGFNSYAKFDGEQGITQMWRVGFAF